MTPPWEQSHRQLVPAAAQPSTKKVTSVAACSAQGQQLPVATIQSPGSAFTPTGNCLLRSVRFQPCSSPEAIQRPPEGSRATNQGNKSFQARSLQVQTQELLSSQPSEQKTAGRGIGSWALSTAGSKPKASRSSSCHQGHEGLVYIPLPPAWTLGFSSHHCLAPAHPWDSKSWN